MTLVQLKGRTKVLAGGQGHVFRPKAWLRNHHTKTVIAAQVSRWRQGLFFFSWWPCCLFCASGIKGRHCWNELQMLARNYPDCSSFFSCLSFECCLSLSLSPLLPFYFSLFAVHTVHIFIFHLFFPTLTHAKLLNLCNNLTEKTFSFPKVRSVASLTPFSRKRRRERKRKRAL